MPTIRDQIDKFFQSKAFAVVGASSDRDKYGNKVLRCYMQHGKSVYPINLHETSIEGLRVLSHLSQLPAEVDSISIITPPEATTQIVDEAIMKGIHNIWMQPGAQSSLGIEKALEHQMNVIAGGPCVLVTLGFHEES